MTNPSMNVTLRYSTLLYAALFNPSYLSIPRYININISIKIENTNTNTNININTNKISSLKIIQNLLS
ncbi:hypothetical protein EYC80_008247 [Monilinia laxa]|uniref:Uncharacterized protein n=1 Tax=Monilinia laxa TaxID=61186 RepID=A0A5N6JV41_MONLA|nr:hypothetical protein EYC80_008247 [Monilinia laxa]